MSAWIVFGGGESRSEARRDVEEKEKELQKNSLTPVLVVCLFFLVVFFFFFPLSTLDLSLVPPLLSSFPLSGEKKNTERHHLG